MRGVVTPQLTHPYLIIDDDRPYSRDMMTTTNKTTDCASQPSAAWRYQHEDGGISYGYPTDARGLRLRSGCGYTHVYMGWRYGWLQIQVAIRKVTLAEALAKIGA